jgi:hypothetical protein
MGKLTALIPPGMEFDTMIDFCHCQDAGTEAIYSYRGYRDHNSQPPFLMDDIIHDRPNPPCAIGCIIAPCGYHLTGAEKLPNTMEHPTLTLSFWLATKNSGVLLSV